MNKIEMRIEKYHLAKQNLNSGKVLEALMLFKATILEYGEHIFLYIDIAACYYTLKDYYLFKIWSYKSLEKFYEVEKIICDLSYLRSVIGIGRFLEELGDFESAINLYKKSLDRGIESDLTVSAKLHAQRLRVKAFLGIREDFEFDYEICERKINYLLQEKDKSYLLDVYHSLMMADHFKGHTSLAEERYKQLLKLELNQYEKNLIFFDHLGECIKQDSFFEKSAMDFLSELQNISYFDCDKYELALWELLEKRKFRADLLKEMSFVGRFNYLQIIKSIDDKNLNLNPLDRQILDESIANVFYLFDKKTQKRIKNRYYFLFENTVGITIEIVGKNITVKKGISLVSFAEDSLNGKLLLLANRIRVGDSLNIEEVISNIYNEQLEISSYEKLRQAVNRLNREISKQLNFDKIIHVSQSKLTRLI